MPLMRSWVSSANSAETPFPLNNLPYGVFSVGGDEPRCGVAIGEMILDMAAVEEAGLITLDEVPCFELPFWNEVMDLGPEVWARLRARLTDLLAEGAAETEQVAPHLVPQTEAQLHMPFLVSEFTDFYAGKHHATNVGTMFRGAENALPPNWLHIPIGYNGRASSVVVSGTAIRRPWGQIKGADHALPRFAPSERFDIELELGAIVGVPSQGPISVAQADANIFGYVLLNDWSARDIQAWEYQPLGPFQSKATATSISPWIVAAAALEPFRCAAPHREVALLPHLQDDGPMHYDIPLSVTLNSETIAQTNARELYYSAAQQLAHHTTSGCPMRVGDLLGSGTISGPERGNRGSLLELSWGGKEPLALANGETRSFIEDGDTLGLHGAAQGDGFQIGFGDCMGTVLPALEDPYKGQTHG
ncbi:fumarylacetoacetase [Roseobacter sinensis]|uniref:fumarylacetoacetase n=1 Tax=Roseobacter sinensis TaxID=2931391 RepID=A0ABT3BJV1_9RHOB|nr:fumarylacetoacetase [Roseobacter sp. WL0113]MCV3273846.1 fumarylacetoacetase [Roseobacter sp. WL0113]